MPDRTQVMMVMDSLINGMTFLACIIIIIMCIALIKLMWGF